MRVDKRDFRKVSDILKAIRLIFSFIEQQDFSTFSASDLLQSAVIRQFEIIGEAAGKISEETQNNFSNVEWHSIKSFRNMLIHEYFKVDAAEVWTSIQIDLPVLNEQMNEILATLSE